MPAPRACVVGLAERSKLSSGPKEDGLRRTALSALFRMYTQWPAAW